MKSQVVLIDCENFTLAERTLAAVLQGVVNRSGPKVFLVNGCNSWISSLRTDKVSPAAFSDGFTETYPSTDHIWLTELSRYGFEFVKTSLYDAICAFKSEFRGLLRFDEISRHTAALTACGLYDLLPVDEETHQKYAAALDGLKVEIDYTGQFADPLEAQGYAVTNLLEKTTDEFVSSYFCEAENSTLQSDYAVMKRAFCYDLNHVTASNLSHAEDEAKSYSKRDEELLIPILNHVKPFGFLWGWGRGGENAIASITAERGIVLLCANMPNASFFAGIPASGKKLAQRRAEPAKIKAENKMYIAFMVNEGDTYKSAATFWNFGSWHHTVAHRDLKINWGVDGLVFRLFPFLHSYFYENATDSDYFFSATTAYGYIHPDFLRKDLIFPYAEKVREMLEFTDTKYFDPWWFSVRDETGEERKWDFLAATGAKGITQWNSANTTLYEGGVPIICSDLYYPFSKAFGKDNGERAKVIANTLMTAREKQGADRPFCTVVYGGDPYAFSLIAEALPKEKFEIVRLDELFAIANHSKDLLTGLSAEYDLKGDVGSWDPTSAQ